jgi:hypothetical protein
MSKILIMGDSWGVGAFRYTDNGTKIEAISNTGPDYFLKKLGHKVDNISITGGSNIEQFDLLTPDYDLIVWFHTEINRDILKNCNIDYTTIKSYIKAYCDTAEHNYKLAQKFYDEYQIPFVVIGCLSPLHSSIEKYNFYTHLEKNWINAETGLNTALNMHSDYMRKVLEKYKFNDYDAITQEIDKMLSVEKILENHSSFSDGVHPTSTMYERLLSKINL